MRRELQSIFRAEEPPRRAITPSYSRVSASDNDLIAGAANNAIGAITTHEISHDESQCVIEGKLAIPAAMRQVSPD
jgi:hypothetical protein